MTIMHMIYWSIHVSISARTTTTTQVINKQKQRGESVKRNVRLEEDKDANQRDAVTNQVLTSIMIWKACWEAEERQETNSPPQSSASCAHFQIHTLIISIYAVMRFLPAAPQSTQVLVLTDSLLSDRCWNTVYMFVEMKVSFKTSVHL